MTIVVTGGAGFIGHHLCKYLLDEGNTIISIDNLYTGKKEHMDKLSLEYPKNFKFIHHDIIHSLILKDIDEIYHLACPASPSWYQKDGIKTLQNNFLGTFNMLQIACQNKARILLTSTSEIYGDPAISPQDEKYRGNTNCFGPRACYDEGKRVAESLMYQFHHQHKVDIRIVRIFNTYGPGMNLDDGRVVTNFVKQVLQGNKITIYGEGKQTRSFCYISDMVNGIIKCMNSKYNQPINLGNPEEITIYQLANAIIKLVPGCNSKISYHPLPQDDPTQRKPNILLAKKILDWEPKVSLNDGLLHMIVDVKSQLSD